MPRHCIFCGAGAGSAEHLFPNWMNESGLFMLESGESDDAANAPQLARQVATEDGSNTVNSWTAAELASATTKWVCHDCNTRWMAKLEARAKPVLVPLIQCRQTVLSKSDQFTIASWATKTAMVCEVSLSENADNFTRDECGVNMQQDRPPASCQVFIAAVEGRITPIQYAASKVRVEGNGEELFKYHFHTIQVACLVLQVLRRIPPPTSYGSLERFVIPREIDVPNTVAHPIFPPSGPFTWPPPTTLDWEGLFALSTRNVALPSGWHALTDPTSPPTQRPE